MIFFPSKTVPPLQINQLSKQMKSLRWQQSPLSKSWCYVDEKQQSASCDHGERSKVTVKFVNIFHF